MKGRWTGPDWTRIMRTKDLIYSIYFPCGDFDDHCEGDEVVLNVEYLDVEGLDPDDDCIRITFGPRPTGALFTC